MGTSKTPVCPLLPPHHGAVVSGGWQHKSIPLLSLSPFHHYLVMMSQPKGLTLKNAREKEEEENFFSLSSSFSSYLGSLDEIIVFAEEEDEIGPAWVSQLCSSSSSSSAEEDVIGFA